MSAPARNSSEETLGETIHHEASPTISGGADPLGGPASARYTYTSGARPLDGYTIRRAIGRGGFGEVYYATSQAGKEVALKLITRNLEVERRGVVQCMNLKSPHLVAIHDLKQNDAGDTFVIMEYIAGPSLAQILAQHPRGLPAHEIRMWLKGLVEGVAYLHDHGIVHRDLKPANMFLEEGVVKIGDYGLTKTMTSQRGEAGHSECVGTCHYMAPETSTGKYHKAIDVYAIGVILHEMVTGRVPFDGESVGEVLMKHLTSRPDLSVLPEPFRGIVARALAKDPNHRPARVTDLLLPGDAPKEPAVRFIGEKSWPPTDSAPSGPKPAAAAEEILRIEAEESVFYIGPDTRPPRTLRARMIPSWVRSANRSRPVAAPARAPRVATAARPLPVLPSQTTPEPLGPPPPLPSGRVRVAELTGSMVLAAPVLLLGSLLTFPAAGLAVGSAVEDPRQIGLLFGMALLGTWGVQIAGKLEEGRSTPCIQRKLGALGIGAAVGLAGYFLALALRMDIFPRGGLVDAALDQVDTLTSSGRARLDLLVEMVAGSALGFLIVPWRNVAMRDRSSRIGLFRLLWAAGAGAAVGAIFPHAVPVVPLTVFLAAFAAQLTTPWDRAAAVYRRQARRRAA